MKGVICRLLIALSPFTFLALHPTFGVISEEIQPDLMGTWMAYLLGTFRVYGLSVFLLVAAGFLCYRYWLWATVSLFFAGVFVLLTL